MHWNQDGSKNDRQAPDPRAEALEELQYRLRQQDLVADFGLFALRSSQLDTLLREAAGVAAQGLGSALGKVLEYLPDRNEFIVRAGVGWKPGTVGRATVGADLQSPAGYAFHTGRPLISNHLENEDRFRTPAVLVEHSAMPWSRWVPS